VISICYNPGLDKPTAATMQPLSDLSASDVVTIVPSVTDVELIGCGGQKRVFKARIERDPLALKFAELPVDEDEFSELSLQDLAARASREVETMRDCDSAHMVKLGPIGLQFAEWNDRRVLYFSEELIDGEDLAAIYRAGHRLDERAVRRLGLQMCDAIEALWRLGKVHRDIKPANIMRRSDSDDFVLLDAGLVFDVAGASLSIGPVGTFIYFSPEQFDFANRRTALDFRSDMFSLGVTMYQLLTGQHPFYAQGDQSHTIFRKISEEPHQPAGDFAEVSDGLEEILERLLGKSPHLRYRTCRALRDALATQ
jgi:serine/threonine protein kinase